MQAACNLNTLTKTAKISVQKSDRYPPESKKPKTRGHGIEAKETKYKQRLLAGCNWHKSGKAYILPMQCTKKYS